MMSGLPGRSGRKPKPKPASLRADGRALKVAPCPDWLTGPAREMWLRVAPLLCEQHVLQITDLQTLEAFCTSYNRFRLAEAELDARGLLVPGANGGMVKNPAGAVVSQAAQQMVTFGAMLGLDPASRRRLVGPDTSTGAGNPFATLLHH